MNRSTCPRKCHKDWNISECLEDYECMKSIAVELLVTCEEIEDATESAVANPGNKMIYWLIAVVLLVVAYFLLLWVMAVK